MKAGAPAKSSNGVSAPTTRAAAPTTRTSSARAVHDHELSNPAEEEHESFHSAQVAFPTEFYDAQGNVRHPESLVNLGEGSFGRVLQCGDKAVKLHKRALTQAHLAFFQLLKQESLLRKYFLVRSKDEFQVGIMSSCGPGMTVRDFLHTNTCIAYGSQSDNGNICKFGGELFWGIVVALTDVLTAFHSAGIAFCDLKLSNMMICPNDQPSVQMGQPLIKFIDLDDLVLFEYNKPGNVKCRVITRMYGFEKDMHPVQNDYIAFCCIVLELLRHLIGHSEKGPPVWPETLPRNSPYVAFTALCLYAGLCIDHATAYLEHCDPNKNQEPLPDYTDDAITLLERYTRAHRTALASIKFMPTWLQAKHEDMTRRLWAASFDIRGMVEIHDSVIREIRKDAVKSHFHGFL